MPLTYQTLNFLHDVGNGLNSDWEKFRLQLRGKQMISNDIAFCSGVPLSAISPLALKVRNQPISTEQDQTSKPNS